MVDLVTPRVLPAFKGRLSYHIFDAARAHTEALKGPYADSAIKAGASKPYANVLLTEGQFEQIVEFLETTFLPFSTSQGEKDKHHIPQDEADAILAQIKAGKKKPYQTPFSTPSDATLLLMPEAVASMKTLGRRGKDIIEDAIVNKADELAIPDPDFKKFPARVPIQQSNHELYSGCWVVGSIEFYAFQAAGNTAIMANLIDETIVFSGDDSSFSGGASLAGKDDDLFAAANS